MWRNFGAEEFSLNHHFHTSSYSSSSFYSICFSACQSPVNQPCLSTTAKTTMTSTPSWRRPDRPPWWSTGSLNGQSNIDRFSRVIHQIVAFFRCGPCKMIAPQYEAFSNKYSQLVFLKVDVDKCEGGKSCIFDKNGKFFKFQDARIESMMCVSCEDQLC